MAESDSRSTNMELRLDAAATAQALSQARDFAEAAGLSSGVAEQLAICIEEWVLNVVEHGGAEGGMLRLALARGDDGVRIAASDPGVAFDPREAEMEGPNLDRGGGVGLALLKAWTTIEAYARVEGRNEVVFLLPCEAD